MPLRFTQSCPTCGRRLQVPTHLYGKAVACQHCRAEFTAGAKEAVRALRDSSQDLLARAEAMLNLTHGVGSGSPLISLDRGWLQPEEPIQGSVRPASPGAARLHESSHLH